MERNTLTIEEIQANPNLDLSERINKLSKDNKFSPGQLNELAIASIKQDYEFWVKNRTNISEKTNDMLEQILNGHILNNTEAFEMICDEPEKVKQYSEYEDMKKKIVDNNGITADDFDKLCKNMGLDSETTDLMRHNYDDKGLIIESYKTDDSYQL